MGYDTPVNEYWNLITNAGLWDVSVQRVIEISGPDANAFINHLTRGNSMDSPSGDVGMSC